jgi:NADH:ubiquinone oxidoreductase subunit E
MSDNNKVGSALVVGSGVGGMQAALDLAESGIKVYLMDSKPSIGGVMSQLDKTFPTNDCAMCSMAPRLVQIGRHKDIEIITLADVQSIEGQPGNFTVSLTKRPRFVNEDKCTGCGTCVTNCPVREQTNIHPDGKVEVKLEPEDLEKMRRIIAEYRGERGALVPILQEINSTYNYLPENALRYVSQEMDIPLSLIYRLATFYNAFSLKPVGKHKITACLGTTCHVKGAPRIVETLERELGIKTGDTTEDMNFTLDTVNCVGCCGLAPVMTVGEDLHGKVTQAKLIKIIEQYRETEVSEGVGYAKNKD